MKDEIKVGLIGFGMAARVFHAPVISVVPGLKLSQIVDRKGNESGVRYPEARVLRDASELLKDPSIDLVVITTPNISHFELSKRALESGKHVVVEKPFTVESKQADLLITLAEEKQLLLSVFQNRRWDGDFKTVRKVLDSEALGRLVEYEAHFDRFRNIPKSNSWREEEGPGSGMLYDLGSHLIDQAQVLFGVPQLVSADIRRQRDGARTDDSFDLLLHYENLKVVLKCGMLVREDGPRFILHGTNGSYVKFGTDPQEEELKKGAIPGGDTWGIEPSSKWGRQIVGKDGETSDTLIETLPGSYQDFYQNILQAIRGEEELIVKPQQARNTIRIIELAIESNALKKALSF